MTALFGTSLALGISSIPFDGPVAGVKVGKIDGVLKVNPTVEEMERSTIDLTVAGTINAINMVERLERSNKYYKLGDNMLTIIPVKDIADWIRK